MPLTFRRSFPTVTRRGSCLLSLLYLLVAVSVVGLAERSLPAAAPSQRMTYLGLVLLLLSMSALLIYVLLARLGRRSATTGAADPHGRHAPAEDAAQAGIPIASAGATEAGRDPDRLLEFASLQRLSFAPAEGQGVQALMQLVCDELGFALAELWLEDESTGALKLEHQWRSLSLRNAAWLSRSPEFRLAKGEGLPGKVWAKGKLRWESDPSGLRSEPWTGPAGEGGLRAAIGVPISDGGAARPAGGVLLFGSMAPHDFDGPLHATLAAIGRQLGKYLESSHEFARLRQSELRYRSLVEHALGRTGVGLMVLDRHQRLAWANESLLGNLGLDGQSATGLTARELFAGATERGAQWERDFISDVLASYNERTHLEALTTRARGSADRPEKWWEYFSRPISEGHYAGGRVEYFVDITRRMRIQMEARRRAQQQAHVADLGMQALGKLDLRVLMQESVEILANDLQVEFSGWFELSPDRKQLLLRAGMGWGVSGDAQLGLPVEVDTHAGYTLFSSAPVIVEDFAAEPRFRRSSWKAKHGIRSGLAVALQTRERPVGVLAAYATTARAYSEDDVSFLRSIANVVGSAIDRSQTDESLSRARDELESRIRVRTQELSSANQALRAEIEERQRAERSARGLLRIAQRLTRNLDPDGLLDELIRESMRLVGATGGCAGLKGERGMAIRKLITEHGELAAEYAWPKGSGLAGWVAENREPYVADDASYDPQIDPEFRERFDIRSAICLPILDSREGVLGFFELHNAQSEEGWSEFDREQLTAVSRVASIAFQNALAYRALKLAEGQLTNSKAQLEEAQRIAQIGSWDWDIEADRLTWSAELFRIYGLDPERDRVSYDRFISLVHPEDRDWLQQRIEQAYQDHQPFSFEHRILTPIGELKVLHGRGKVILDSSGKPVRMVGTGQDITATKSMEQALVGQSRLYENLVEAQSDLGLGVIVTEGRQIVYANQALVEICGYSPAELSAFTDMLDLVVPEQRSEVEVYLEAAARGEAGPHCEATIRHRDGQERNIEFSVKLAGAESGERTFAIVRDVTPRVMAMQRIRRSEEQLRQFSAYLEDARELERGTIAREIHDELGQALTGLKMDVSWIQQRLAASELTPEHQHLMEKAEAMSELIDVTIQAVRRIATELRPGVLDDLGLIPAIEWQVSEFSKRTGINCNLVSNIEDLELDRRVATGAFRILQEALTNVARHSEATQVKVRLKAMDGAFHLEIEDNGIGLRREPKNEQPSLGILGMQERAHLLGGQVQLDGELGEGTRVRVRLPIEGAIPAERVLQ